MLHQGQEVARGRMLSSNDVMIDVRRFQEGAPEVGPDARWWEQLSPA